MQKRPYMLEKDETEIRESAQRRFLRSIFLQHNYEFVGPIFKTNNLLTVFGLYVMKKFRKVFEQLSSESLYCFKDGIGFCEIPERKKIYYPLDQWRTV